MGYIKLHKNEVCKFARYRIKKNIDIIHDSHMSNSKKREAYLDFDKELIEVLSLITRLNNINKTIMSHE